MSYTLPLRTNYLATEPPGGRQVSQIYGVDMREHAEAINDAASAVSTFVSSERPYVTPMDFGAVGDGSDETAELLEAIAQVDTGGLFIFPPDRTFGFTGTLDFGGAVVQGRGWYAQSGTDRAAGAALKAISPDAMVTVTSGKLRDLIIDCNNVGEIGVYIGLQDRTSMDNVMVWEATQAGFVLDGTQNLTAVGCSAYRCGTGATPAGWPGTAGWLLMNGTQTDKFYDCTTAGATERTDADYRAWLVADILTDARFSNDVFGGANGGNGGIHWYGGINEYNTADHRVEILNAAPGQHFGWYDTIFAGPINDGLVHIGPDAGALYNDNIFGFHNCVFSMGDADTYAVKAESGLIRFTGASRMTSGDQRGLRDKVTLTGNAGLYMDEQCRQLLLDSQRRFDANTTATWLAAGGTIGWDSATSRLTYTGTTAGQGIYNSYRGQGGEAQYGTYSKIGRLIRLRCFLTDVVGASGFKLQHVALGGNTDITGGALTAGYNEKYFTMTGNDEYGIFIAQVATETASFKLAFIDIEHIAG